MLRQTTPDELADTESAWRNTAAACKDALSRTAILFLPSEGGGWVNSAVEVATGQTVTLLASGQVWLSREANLALGPNVTLWYRIGDGPIARCVANTG